MNKTISILIFLPIIYTIIFGELFSNNVVNEIPIIFVNLDDGTQAQKIFQNISDAEEIKIVKTFTDDAEIEKKIFENKSFGAVIIPKNFSQKISRGENISVELIIDNTNTILGGTVSRAIQNIISNFNAEILMKNRIANGQNFFQSQNFLTLRTRIFYNPTSGYIDFFLTVLILHSLQIAIVFSISPTFCEEKFKNNFKTLAKKFFIYNFVAISSAAISFSIGIKFFGMICRGNFFEIFLLIGIFIFCMTSFAIFVGAFVNFPHKTIIFTLAYIMTSILFTGAIWKRYSMDNLSLILSYIMPIGWAADDLRNLFLKGTAINLEKDLFILILMSGIFFILAVIGVKKSWK